MIHKIKAMYDEGRGSSLRAIAEELRISRNTVRKYLAMSAEEITAYQERKGRSKRLGPKPTFVTPGARSQSLPMPNGVPTEIPLRGLY